MLRLTTPPSCFAFNQNHFGTWVRFQMWPETSNMVALNKYTAVVYLLDDDPSILKATSRLLDSHGWRVEAFIDPFVFLERAAIDCPDVAVIDIVMPDMNGLEVQTRLRRVSPSTRVIVLTGKDDPSVRRVAMNGGASAFFIKDVESGEFLAGVKTAADSRA